MPSGPTPSRPDCSPSTRSRWVGESAGPSPPGQARVRSPPQQVTDSSVPSTTRRISMEFMRIGARDQETPVVRVGDDHFDISSVVSDIDPAFWADGPARVAQALEAGSLPKVNVEGQRFGAPITRPSAVICIGQNYVEHAAESGDPAPEQPIIFFKTPNTITGPYDAIGIPPRAEKFDWEVELGIVIGKQAAYLESREEALGVIGGYLAANDLSERVYQSVHSGGQW